MDKKIILLFAILVLFVTQACKEGLEEEPYSSISPQTLFINEDGLKKATYGVYESFASWPWPFRLWTFIVTEVGHRYTSFGQTGSHFVDPYNKFGETPTDAQAATQWSEFYKAASRANAVIANAPKAVPDETKAKVYIAEARFLRAYAYFMLVRLFGDVPLVKEEISSLSQSDQIYGPRVPVADVYGFIEEDLKFAEANLPDKWMNSADIGRVNAGVAKAMMGKVYLTMAGKPLSKSEYFQKAADKLMEVVGQANEEKYGFGLIENFPDVFSLANERNPELLLSFGHFASSTNQFGSIYPFFLAPRGLIDGDEQTCYGLTYDFYQLYEDNDTRRDFTLPVAFQDVITGDSIKYDPTYPGYMNVTTNTPAGIERSGIALGKFARDRRFGPPWGYDTDQIHLRFSDVLLLLAEALGEQGKVAEALPYLNRVRERAHVSQINVSSQEDFRKAIRKERLLELIGEYTTVFDVRRWGTLKEEIAAMTPDQIQNRDLNPYDPKLELYPIPQAEIDANPNLTQNPGW